MGIQLGVLESNKVLLHKILDILGNVYEENKKIIDPISVIHIKTIDQAIDFIKFEFPEFLIINMDDKKLDSMQLLEVIESDPWLHSTGLIILYEKVLENRSQLLNELNIMSFLKEDEINYQLPKILKIILTNTQVLVQKDLYKTILEKRSGSFEIENDPSIVTSYVNIITSTLLNEKYINQNKAHGLRIALTELLMNGIEHGNCEITFEEKSAFLTSGGNINELIHRKCKNSEIAKRRVYLDYEFTEDLLKFTIRDDGDGFDHSKQNYNPENEEDLLREHGRGIFMTEMFVESLTYNDKGNEATILVKTDKESKSIPVGFVDQKELHVKAGDIIFKQGDKSNHLYYIVKGIYEIEVQGKKIAELKPSDIFLGEMSFLLNNVRVAAVKAKTDGILIEIAKNSFINIIKKYPNYGLFLSKLLAKRLEKTNELKVLST
ncbi:MAG: cyclic nucleotide-binding domain-containing protein [Spirochaetes bacterium]|nr:cyclic nucleotide-binding domain-containing protein [Spirochaetota bacterium]